MDEVDNFCSVGGLEVESKVDGVLYPTASFIMSSGNKGLDPR